MFFKVVGKVARLGVIAALAFGSWFFSARPTYAYNLSALCALSSDIVEADIKGLHSQGSTGFADVRIDEVFKGRLAAGQTVLVRDLDHFAKGFEISPRATKRVDLQVGDHLFLFLEPAVIKRGNVPLPPSTFDVVANGMELVEKEEMYGFSEFMSPSSYMAYHDKLEPQAAQPPAQKPVSPVTLFIARLREGIADDAAEREYLMRLGAPPSPAEGRALFALLKKRSVRLDSITLKNIPLLDAPGLDSFTADVCARIIDAGDYDLLREAMLWAQTQHAPSFDLLCLGFGSPGGRSFLLKWLADPRESYDNRLLYIGIIAATGQSFYSKNSDASRRHYIPTEPDQKDNNNYLTRLAQIASNGGLPEFLRIRLISIVGQFILRDHESTPRALVEDARSALQVLTQLRATAPSYLLQQTLDDLFKQSAENEKYLADRLSHARQSKTY